MKARLSELPNGLKIATLNMPASLSITAAITVGVGSRYEDHKNEAGVTHFLEHLLFKGTKRWPTSRKIAEAVDAVGGYNNAYTSEDLTSYYLKLPKESLSLGLDILADMVSAPLLAEGEIERERGVVVEEMHVYQDDPARYVGHLIPGLLWPGNGLAEEIIGTEEIIRSIPKSRISQFVARHYHPNNMVLTVAGRVNHNHVVAQANDLLGHLRQGDLPEFSPITGRLSPKITAGYKQPTNQAHIIIASRGYAYGHTDRAAAKVLAALLGQGMSSRLYTEVREKRGLAYSVHAGHSSYVDTGMMEIYAGVSLDKTGAALDAIFTELVKVAQRAVGADELQKSKSKLKGGLALSLESNANVSDMLGRQLTLEGRVVPVEETVAQIDAVTPTDIKRVAQEMLRPEGLRLGVISPQPESIEREFINLVKRSQ